METYVDENGFVRPEPTGESTSTGWAVALLGIGIAVVVLLVFSIVFVPADQVKVLTYDHAYFTILQSGDWNFVPLWPFAHIYTYQRSGVIRDTTWALTKDGQSIKVDYVFTYNVKSADDLMVQMNTYPYLRFPRFQDQEQFASYLKLLACKELFLQMSQITYEDYLKGFFFQPKDRGITFLNTCIIRPQ